MKDDSENIGRLRILNDIYRNENEYLKKEYRNLYDQYILEKNKNENRGIINKTKKLLRRLKRGKNE